MARTKRATAPTTEDFIPFAGALDALSDPTRVHIVTLLAAGPNSVSGLVETLSKRNGEFAVKQPTVSHHLRVLRSAGLVSRAQVGRVVTYSIAAEYVINLANELIRIARPAVAAV